MVPIPLWVVVAATIPHMAAHTPLAHLNPKGALTTQPPMMNHRQDQGHTKVQQANMKVVRPPHVEPIDPILIDDDLIHWIKSNLSRDRIRPGQDQIRL